MCQGWVSDDDEVISVAEGERFPMTAKMIHWVGFKLSLDCKPDFTVQRNIVCCYCWCLPGLCNGRLCNGYYYAPVMTLSCFPIPLTKSWIPGKLFVLT